MNFEDYRSIAKLSVAMILKENDDAALGRIAPNESQDSDMAVPNEIPAETEPEEEKPRELSDILQDAIEVLAEGLSDAVDADESEEQEEPPMPDMGEEGASGMPPMQMSVSDISHVVTYLQKALQGEDVPISVKAMIKDSSGRVLILRSGDSEYWDLPGGHVAEGETIDDALYREIMEETGLEVLNHNQTDTRMLDYGNEVRPVLFYDVEIVGGQPRCSQEHIGYQWAGDEDLRSLNLGVFKDILIPGVQDNEILEVDDPATRRAIGPQQIPEYTVKDVEKSVDIIKSFLSSYDKEDGGGIAGAGDSTTGSDVHTPAIGAGKRRKLKALVDDSLFKKWTDDLKKVSTGGGQFVTGEETDHISPVEHKEQRPVGNETVKETYLDSAENIGAVKLMKNMPGAPLEEFDLRLINKAQDGRFVVAGYASPVIVDQEGHRVSHEALANDLPRFMAQDGRYANVNISHSNVTVGKVIPEFKASDGTVYETKVDDIGLYAVAEVRTDEDAPEIVHQVIKDIEDGKLRSFSISGNADNPTFMCDSERCFYDIGKVSLYELTICNEGVNQGAKFDIVS